MSIVVVSPNSSLKTLIEEVFSLLGLQYKFLKILPSSKVNYDVVITDSTELAAQLKSQFVFLISNDENAAHGHLRRVFKAPVRVGNLCDEVLYFLKQKQINRDLKPLNLGRFVLHPSESVLEQGKSKVKLTDKELSILLHLAAQHPQKTPRNDLLDHVWGYADGVETHTLETHIYRLRQKIESDPAYPEFLMTDDEGYFLNL